MNLFGGDNARSIQSGGTGSNTDTAFNGGITAGYGFRSGSIVFGGELDFGYMPLKTGVGLSRTYPTNAPNAFSISTEAETELLFTARGRLGYLATPSLLLYGTAGVALTELAVSTKFSENFFTPPASGQTSVSDWKAGFVIGGGAEWAIDKSWSLKGEYLFTDFGKITTQGRITTAQNPNNPVPFTSSGDLTVQAVRIGLNYRF